MQVDTKEERRRELAARLSDSDFIVKAVHEAAKRTLEDHIRTGDPIAGWRDGKVVWIPADEIQIEEISG